MTLVSDLLKFGGLRLISKAFYLEGFLYKEQTFLSHQRKASHLGWLFFYGKLSDCD